MLVVSSHRENVRGRGRDGVAGTTLIAGRSDDQDVERKSRLQSRTQGV